MEIALVLTDGFSQNYIALLYM